MTPEEKSKELIKEMIGGCCRCQTDANKAAITCCDEIINALSAYNPYSESIYWEQVKQHIQEL